MKTLNIFACVLAICLLVTVSVQAEDQPRFTRGGDMTHGGSPGFAKAGADTINLMAASDDPTNNADPRDGGLEPYFDGDFSDAAGLPDWNGWTHYDITRKNSIHWNVSNYNQPDPSNHAAWCGDINFAACDTSDAPGGYGNYWREILEFRQAVPNPGSSSVVFLTATMIMDTEPAYDYIYLSYRMKDQFYTDLQVWDGGGTVAVSDSLIYLPGDYVDGTDIALYFRFKSDGGWSDEDFSFPSAGACQIDDINVHLDNGGFIADYFEDFEHGGDPADFGIWNPILADGVGDFAQIWVGLEDEDPCATNITAQVAFIDDDIVVPGTGGSDCINWCYGPYGYIVNTTGGLEGPDDHLHNAIESPAMAWPAPKDAGAAVYDGIILEFGVYVHEDLSADSPGIFYTWGVRSADTDGSAGNGIQVLAEMPWRDRNFVYYGGPEYKRSGDDVTDLMNAGRDVVQVQLTAYELGWIWYWTGDDGYPAPYFDNVTVKVFPYHGPGMSARQIDLAQDNFPEQGTIDLNDLGSNHVRFDSAYNISLAAHLRNDPGDSILVDINPVRAGADLDGKPKLHYFLDPNPKFDSQRGGQPLVGFVYGFPAISPYSDWWDGKWGFDLPDTGFIFPGDVLHYFIEATDAIGGLGGSDPQTALLPPDTTGFSTGFGDPLGYNSTFTVHALPTLRDVGFGGAEQPPVLFINDYADLGGENKWYTALNSFSMHVGEDFDVYHVNGPSSGVGNGIGGRATPATLSGYSTILYTSGDLARYTITNGDYIHDAGDDVGVMTAWLDMGEKDMFLTGDNLASDLIHSGAATVNFLGSYMGLLFADYDVRRFINNQTTPLVTTVSISNPADRVFYNLSSWIAYGACPIINEFDAVQAAVTAVRQAEFTDPSGYGGQYPYAAATLNRVGTSRIVSMPVDLMNVASDPSSGGQLASARTLLVKDVLEFFGFYHPYNSVPDDLPGITFQAHNYPNPFNPSTTIKYSLPKAGHLKLSVYNVRGQLVKTLVDGQRPAGANQTIVWDGSNNQGSAAASGTYFYEARAAGEVKIGKMTLLK